jgi:[NiFe] hydrogenase assembly HybE family chaperone
MDARAARTVDDGRYECGVCWSVYDPALGDPVAQIQPGVPFSSLPENWRCPECDAPRERFLALASDGGSGPRAARAVRGPAAAADAVRAAYLAVDEQMRGLPIHNPRLAVDTIGFRRVAGASVGVAITPWSMMVLRLPDEPDERSNGEMVTRAFPSGEYDFTVGELVGVGRIESCSLFSPMDVFDDFAVARTAGEAAIAALFAAEPIPESEPSPASRTKPVGEPAPTRRALILGRRG